MKGRWAISLPCYACTTPLSKACSVWLPALHLLLINMEKEWFKLKPYPHIGLPFSFADRRWIGKYVSNSEALASHAFSPFIHREIVTRKFRKQTDGSGTKTPLRIPGKKIRDIYYSSHLDSFVYSYYAINIQELYEQTLTKFSISRCVTAYRSIPLEIKSSKQRNKCNIDFAYDVFNYIRNCSNENLTVITYDIKSFFDTLDHKHLKRQWREVIGSGLDLPPDHYNIFRSLTKFSYVNEKEIFREFKSAIFVETPSGIVKQRAVDRRKYLKEKNAIAFCQTRDLEVLRAKNYIKSNKRSESGGELRNKGIPQGSPISAVLANIYMLPFDKACNDFLGTSGIYRRYSDDIIIVCDSKKADAIKAHIHEQIAGVNLEIQTDKTQTFKLLKSGARYKCFKTKDGIESNQASSFEYLGFTFNGEKAYLKCSSIAKYYRKMKRGMKRAKFFSTHNKTSTKGEIFKARLYKRFTYKGAERRRIFKRKPGTTDEWMVTKRYEWGNYLSYVDMAARIMNHNGIRNQLKRHWPIFHSLLNK